MTEQVFEIWKCGEPQPLNESKFFTTRKITFMGVCRGETFHEALRELIATMSSGRQAFYTERDGKWYFSKELLLSDSLDEVKQYYKNLAEKRYGKPNL